MTQSKQTRGIRFNNPGNLVKTNIPWKGKIKTTENGRYEVFNSPHNGIRAMYMDLKNDIEKDGKNTISKLLAEYAPKFENPLKNYIDFVSKKLEWDKDDPLNSTHYLDLIKAIIFFENGSNPYSDDQIMRAMLDGYSQ